MIDCFIGLGGNYEKTLETIESLLRTLNSLEGIYHLRTSHLYSTSPVSSIDQPYFLNAAAHFQTNLPPLTLFYTLEGMEKKWGKVKKEKNAPRLIDIDILFYGNETLSLEGLDIPHPRLFQRLFVLIPLADLIEFFPITHLSIEEHLKNFKNINNERVSKLPYALSYYERKNKSL